MQESPFQSNCVDSERRRRMGCAFAQRAGASCDEAEKATAVWDAVLAKGRICEQMSLILIGLLCAGPLLLDRPSTECNRVTMGP